jgi:flavin-dependent dehydrogenase
VRSQVEKIGIVKRGAEFVSKYHEGKSVTYYFKGARDKNNPYAYQVRRSEFDHILLKNSEEKGTGVHEGVIVTQVDLNSGGDARVAALHENGQTLEWQTRYVVDASGRDSFLAKQLGLREVNQSHNSAAIYSHFENAEILEGDDRGNISIYWFDEGWIWMIPLRDSTMSIGAVCRPNYLKKHEGELDDFLWKILSYSPDVLKRIRKAKMVIPSTVTSNFSYYSKQLMGENYILVGDAYAFIDPIFSSGVHLALKGGIYAVDVIEASLQKKPSLARYQKRYKRRSTGSLKILSWFIYRMNQPAMRNLFMAPRNILGIEKAVLSMLAGDVYRKVPFDFQLFLFKILYYINFIAGFKENWKTYKLRKPLKKGKNSKLI